MKIHLLSAGGEASPRQTCHGRLPLKAECTLALQCVAAAAVSRPERMGPIDMPLTLPLSRKDLLPKRKCDRSLFIVMLVCVPGVFIFDVCYVLPRVLHECRISPYMHVLFALFILLNVGVNMTRLLQSKPAARDLPPSTLPNVLLPNWFYCHDCHLNVPPRSYHCRACNECILKQDHHCMFAGKCIGFANQRYFVVGVAYVMLGACYSLYFHLNWIIETLLGGYRWPLLLSQMAPHLGWLFGAFDGYGFLAACLNLFEVCVAVFCFTLLYSQGVCIMNNQTMHERRRDVKKFVHASLVENIRDVFGDRWLLVWIWPFVDSPPKGDGVNFETYPEVEERKYL
ncbi:putative palmitoyltransferase ZDHHC24-like [Tropilaelaps mercedesae]|uniref:Palmitoyltransferase n=1 Tax=Tropilaelaps mercedesae TaxID=418985 RepID=A0A1V9X0L0_9ACAR|nr:putative palmitoyltransferase ZDHHC24-like [Tropilaelaps mercedesae]